MPASDYDIDPNTGLITNPGKFESERPELVTAYELYLNGFADIEDDFISVELPSGEVVKFYEDELGFVNEIDETLYRLLSEPSIFDTHFIDCATFDGGTCTCN